MAEKLYQRIEKGVAGMKRKICALAMTLFIALFASAAFGAADAEGQGAPDAVVPDAEFQFPPTVEGDEVIHDFVIKNTGTAPLEIQKVQTG